MRIWGNDGANRGGLRRKLRAEQERERKLVLRHRWYAGGVATLISAALVFTGVSTPALADVVPPPAEDTSQATTPPTDTPPAETPPAVETPPVDPAVPPADTTTPPADTTTPPAETTPTDAPTAPAEPKTDQTQSRQAVDELVVTPLAVGPDGATPPYVYWRALDQNGSPLAGATFYLQGPRESGGFSDSSNSRWDANEATVTDCVVAPCAGPDLDSDPGEFLVKTFDGHTVTATNRYRVQQTAAPAGYIPTTLNTYRFIPGSGATPTTSPWTGNTYSFGDFLHTVPVPGTVTIQKGGLRTGAQAVGGLEGATFDVYKGGTASTPDTAAANLVGSCVTAANGQCSVPVPPGAEYWIIERSAPSGWSMIDQLYVGGSDGSQTNTPYRFRTGSVSAGSNTTYPVVGTGSGATTSSGYWADVKNNPAALQACGIRVGLLVDLSNSIDSTELTQLKNAANGFVDALQGTPSTLAMWTFATNAPANGANNGSLGLTSVSTPAGATIVKNKISGLTQPGGDQGGTNWDQGLWQVANDAANKVDVLLMLTDGTPTFYGPSADGPGSYSRFREVESAVFSANAVKQLGTRVVPVGIGVGNAVANIKAISGPAVNSDYYLVDNYAALAAFLQNLAKGQCDSTINVTKLVQPAGGGTATATPGWGFTATSNNAVTPGAGNTNASGAISFKVAGLTAGQSAAVNITEENRAGYTLVQQAGGKNAVCKDETGAAVSVTNNGALGFTANATGGKIVSCTVINQAPNPQVKLQVIKKWVINGTPYENNDATRPFGSAALTLNTVPATFGNEYTYNVGDNVAIAETVTGLPTFCTNVSSGTGTHVMTSTPTPNVVTVTNTVTCSTQLKLTKKVANGETSATTWTLFGTGPGGALAGPTGNGPTTALTNVTPAARYVLSETGTDLRYTQEVAPNAVPVAGSSGSWHCYILDAQGNRVSEGAGGLNGWVEVQLGQHVDCEAINQTAQLTILKHVVNDNGGTAEADDWTLSATPKPVLAGLAPITGVVGAEGATTANTKYVRPDYTYTINETGPAQGYTKVRLERLVNGAWVEVVGFDVSVTALGHETYRIVNDDVAPKLTLIKSVTNDNGGNAQPTAWTLTASTPGGPNLSGTTGVNGTVEAGEVYTIAENSGPSGYTWDSLSCTGYPNTTKAAPTLTLKPGDDVTCTLVNNDQPGSLTLVKVVDNANGGTAVATDWNGNLHAKRGADTTLNYNTGEAKQVAAGTYTLSETGQLAGYTLTNLVCSTGGTTLANNTVAVANGATVTCTFTNTAQQPTLTLEKQVVNTGGGISTADAWTLKATAGANSPINGIGSPAGGLVASISGSVLGDTTYTLTESGPSGYTSTGVWACVVTGTSTVVPVTNSNQVKTTVGQNATCRIVNTAVPGTAQIAKVAGAPVQNADGTWTIPYTITVTNTSAASTVTYNLTDTLSFGAGITVNSASWTGPDASGGNFTGSNATMATGKQLTKATLTHVYHVTANASIASGVPAGTTWQCSATDPKRAFVPRRHQGGRHADAESGCLVEHLVHDHGEEPGSCADQRDADGCLPGHAGRVDTRGWGVEHRRTRRRADHEHDQRGFADLVGHAAGEHDVHLPRDRQADPDGVGNPDRFLPDAGQGAHQYGDSHVRLGLRHQR
ncbi:SpaA isopeptide-forming pilin-related protein [Microbacterium sp. Root61]|uniref:SpaA isopeptide-forming pilin-related protein n=1 Tax=Microbacterium sp. Root61 TaxID=1736570 RepID=UPI0009E96280|nr:SpaA isopeptide-forming pilin-related protein [Microbacterium sp. Root61]